VSTYAYFKVGAFIMAFPIAGAITNAMRDRFFPAKSILIGQAKERSKNLEPVQRIVIPVVLSAVVGAATWLLNLLARVW
jgi:hypothetical protein